MNIKHHFFKSSFFPSTIIEWIKLDLNLKNSRSYEIFKRKILTFVRLSSNSVFFCHNSEREREKERERYLTRRSLAFSRLRCHNLNIHSKIFKSKHCSCSLEVEVTRHFLLHCPNFTNDRRNILKNLHDIECSILK